MITRVLVIVVTVLLTVIGATTHAAELQPLKEDSERLSVTWDVADRRGRQVVEGYVNSRSSYPVLNLRVLVDRLDEAGRILDQRVAWVPGTLGADERLYFRVPVDAAPRYRVRVFSYDRGGTGGL